MKLNKNKKTLTLLLTGCVLSIVPANAWALQSHGAPEGLYVHQMAHIFAVLATAYWFWDIRRSSFHGRGWGYLQIFCVLMLTWNAFAFTGHAVSATLAAEHIFSETGYLNKTLIGSMDLHKTVFYLTRFDHLIIVPALFFLFIGMRSLYKQHNQEVEK